MKDSDVKLLVHLANDLRVLGPIEVTSGPDWVFQFAKALNIVIRELEKHRVYMVALTEAASDGRIQTVEKESV